MKIIDRGNLVILVNQSKTILVVGVDISSVSMWYAGCHNASQLVLLNRGLIFLPKEFNKKEYLFRVVHLTRMNPRYYKSMEISHALLHFSPQFVGFCIICTRVVLHWLNQNIHYFDFMSQYLMVQKLRHFENLQSWLWAFRIRGRLLCQS